MASIGRINKLKVNRSSSIGLYLDDGDNGEILLPNKYISDDMHLGEFIEVFVYLDGEERPVATTEKPTAFVNEFAILRVVDMTEFGAFLDWGVTKQLFLPHAEQLQKVNLGDEVLVYIHLDLFSQRLVASAKVEQFLNTAEQTDYVTNQVVKVVPYAATPLGFKCIVDYAHTGMIYGNEVFEFLTLGKEKEAFVKKLREDGKLDISLYKLGHEKLDDIAEALYDLLVSNPRVRELTDKSDPNTIARLTNMSKKNFKKALGGLYKAKRVDIVDGGIKVL